MAFEFSRYKIELKWGLILGLCVSLWVMFEFLLGFHTTRMEYGVYSGYIASLIPLICLWYGVREVKKKFPQMRFLQGFASGMCMVFFAALIVTSFFYVYNVYINPVWMDNGYRYVELQLNASGMNQTQMSEQLVQLRSLYTLEGQLFAAFMGITLQGLIISLAFAYMQRYRGE